MREIKFRAWDKKKKKWLHGYKELGGCHILGETILLGEWCSVEMARLNDIEVMQYTGLKDKNGKEIYERDVVRYLGDIEKLDDPYHEREVLWRKETCSFMLRKIKKASWDKAITNKWTKLHKAGSDNKLEVIDNIHQNPELLGGVLNE